MDLPQRFILILFKLNALAGRKSGNGLSRRVDPAAYWIESIQVQHNKGREEPARPAFL